MNSSIRGLGYLFYIVNPKDHIYHSLDQVPDYIAQATPFFVVLVLIEQLVLITKGWKRFRVSDSLVSAGQGILMEQLKLLMKGQIMYHYVKIYEGYAIVRLSPTATNWIATLVAVDFLFYWFHRASHEINILWAFHQAHHSSEHFNLTTALRQSIFQVYLHCLFNVPLALFIPPPIYMVHLQLNVLYQFWIHTDLVPKLGPIEFIFNTPSAHRVHHGRNRYCIDKNYAGLLVIWDRIFKTYQEEKELIAYGLVHPINTFDPVAIQGCHLTYIWKELAKAETLSTRLSILFKGPGWSQGKPRLGVIEDVPEIDASKVVKYDPPTPLARTIYVGLHSILVLALHVILVEKSEFANYHHTVAAVGFVAFSIFCLSKLLESRRGFLYESVRCGLFFTFADSLSYSIFSDLTQILSPLKAFFIASLTYCAVNVLSRVRTVVEKRKIQ